MQTGRNDPCPCGSEKKYKKCCLNPPPDPREFEWKRLRAADEALSAKLIRFAARREGDRGIEKAWREYFGPKAGPFDPESPEVQVFYPWLFFSRRLGGSEPLAESFLREDKTDEPERRLIVEALAEPFSFHEALEVERGRGLRARDVLLGTERRVWERSGSEQIQAGDLSFARVVTVGEVSLFLGSGSVLIPPSHKGAILDLRADLRTGHGDLTREVLRDSEAELRAVYLELRENLLHPPMPQLQNTDGDPIEFSKVRFTVSSAHEAFEGLRTLRLREHRVEEPEEAVYDATGRLTAGTILWAKKGNRLNKSWDNTTLGTIRFEGKKLTVEVNSRKRAEKIQKEIARRLGPKASYQGTEIRSVDSVMNDPAMRTSEEERRKNEELNALPEVRAHLRALAEKNSERWVEERVPALRGKTPRQALKDPDDREMLEALLCDFERRERAQIAAGREPTMHVARIREKLGLGPRGGNP